MNELSYAYWNIPVFRSKDGTATKLEKAKITLNDCLACRYLGEHLSLDIVGVVEWACARNVLLFSIWRRGWERVTPPCLTCALLWMLRCCNSGDANMPCPLVV